MRSESYKVLFFIELCWHNTIAQIESILRADPDVSLIVMVTQGYDKKYWKKMGLDNSNRVKLLENPMSGLLGFEKGVLRTVFTLWRERIDLAQVSMAWSIEARNYVRAHHITGVPFIVDLRGKERDYKTLPNRDQIIKVVQESAFQLCHDQTLVAMAQEITGSGQSQYLLYNACDPRSAERPFDVKNIKQKLGIPLQKKVILYNHRLIPFKRPLVFVKAMKLIREAYPSACFLFLGARGGLRQEVRDSIQAFGLSECTVWLDQFLNGLELGEVYAVTDVSVNVAELVVPSQATLEAMSFGIPLVVADELDSELYVQHGVNGFIVAPEPGIVAEAVVRILQNEELRRRMGAAGRARAIRFFDIRDWGKRVTQCYRHVLFGEPLPPPWRFK